MIRVGLDIKVYSFKRPIVHNLTPEMQKVIKDTIYFPSFLLPYIYFSQLFFLYHIPIRYFQTMLKVFFGSYQRFTTFKLRLRSIVNFLRGVHLSYLLKGERDSIHIHTQFANNTATAGYISSSLLGIPFSFRSHTSYNTPILKDKIEKARFILSASEFDGKQLVEWSDGKYKDNIEVDYLGVDLKEWRKKKHKEEDGLIVSVGRLTEKKGFEYLITAAEILKEKGLDFYIEIAGDGPLSGKIDNLIKEKNLVEYINILGYISHNRVRKLISGSSIFCLSCVVASNGDVDVCPLVLMEAMALEKPVISTTVSGIPELIDDGINGVLVPQKNPTALANAIEKLLKDTKLRNELGKEARKKIERDFNLHKNIRKTADIFRKYIGA